MDKWVNRTEPIMVQTGNKNMTECQEEETKEPEMDEELNQILLTAVPDRTAHYFLSVHKEKSGR